ncbi:hypothetical protein M404DRAFT_858862 [Pisolithus tinctorius Marx 270]|uniref:Uncharacterized protein n=1 Tax=Pisolithus tinctorius Marx 270 TaxID=870435 RepID=A0A0C3IMK1_PISTI|nr:hypothetical protein M404DRAFT_858862 [Pisolithus tinctorius Marx 270]
MFDRSPPSPGFPEVQSTVVIYPGLDIPLPKKRSQGIQGMQGNRLETIKQCCLGMRRKEVSRHG